MPVFNPLRALRGIKVTSTPSGPSGPSGPSTASGPSGTSGVGTTGPSPQAAPSGNSAGGLAGRPAGVSGGTNSKSIIRYEQIARYRVAGRLSDQKIAEMVGLTPLRLSQIVNGDPTYKEIEESLLEGRLSAIDMQLAGEEEEIRNIARAAVPAALRALVDGVTQRRDLRSALVAAKTILQFDPDKTLTEQGKAPAFGGDFPEGDPRRGPQLPENVIAYLSMQGNKVVAEIRCSPSGNPPGGQVPSKDNVIVDPSLEGRPNTPAEVAGLPKESLSSLSKGEKSPIPLVMQTEGEA